MLDVETICAWMEEKPPMSPGRYRETHDRMPTWWTDHQQIGGAWWPVDLTLDRLHEAEKRLTNDQWQMYRDEILRGEDMLGLWMVRLIHASPFVKVRALAAVIRSSDKY